MPTLQTNKIQTFYQYEQTRLQNLRALFTVLIALTASIPLFPSSSMGSDVSQLVAKAESLFLVRAEGQVKGLALAEPIGQVVALYEEAAAIEPDNLEITWNLLQALEYKAAHALPKKSPDRRPVFDRARQVCESALDLAAAKFGSRKALYKASAADLNKKGIDATTLASVYFWGVVDWPGWAKAHGIFAAATQGVASRLFEYANQVVALDPELQEGAGYRLLAQLHTTVPRIPFVTSWVNPEQALIEMDRAEAIAPGDPHNKLFLAEALLKARPESRDRIERLLRATSALVPRPDRLAEDWELKNKADKLLADFDS